MSSKSSSHSYSCEVFSFTPGLQKLLMLPSAEVKFPKACSFSFVVYSSPVILPLSSFSRKKPDEYNSIFVVVVVYFVFVFLF